MRIRQLLAHALLGVVLVLAWSGSATAGKKSSDELPIGGQTIGGPSSGSIVNQGDMLTVFEEPGSGIDVCATIVNTQDSVNVENHAKLTIDVLGFGQVRRGGALGGGRIIRVPRELIQSLTNTLPK